MRVVELRLWLEAGWVSGEGGGASAAVGGRVGRRQGWWRSDGGWWSGGSAAGVVVLRRQLEVGWRRGTRRDGDGHVRWEGAGDR